MLGITLFRRYNNQLGQGLVELAILGSILIMVIGFLFMLGINYNRYQDLNMRTARNARAMAYSPLYRDHQRQINLTMVEDKPVMDFSSSSLQPTYSPYVAGASDVWSDQIYYDYDPSRDNWTDIMNSVLDLPSQNFVVNGNFIDLQTGSYRDKYSFVAAINARKKRDISLTDPGSNSKCIVDITRSPTASWCWENVDVGDLEQGDAVDFFPYDGKEELVLRKIDPSDTLFGEFLAKLGLNLGNLGGKYFLVLNYQKSAIDGTINSKDYFLHNKETQGLKPELETVTGGNSPQREEFVQRETPTETSSTWKTNIDQEVTHHFDLNPNIGVAELATAEISTAAIGAPATFLGSGAVAVPQQSFWTGDETGETGKIKKEFQSNGNYSWTTPK